MICLLKNSTLVDFAKDVKTRSLAIVLVLIVKKRIASIAILLNSFLNGKVIKMLNEDKIKLMTKMAMYADSPEGKEAIEASKFFKHDYLARKIIWTEICVKLAYIFITYIAYI